MLRFISELIPEYSHRHRTADIQRRIDKDYDLLGTCDSPDGTPILRVWNNPDCLVTGKQIKRWPGYEEARAASMRKGWTVFERATGGTIVPHYRGVLNVSYIVPNIGPRKSLSEAYNNFCSPIIRTLASFGVVAGVGAVPGSYCDGDSNITVSGRKIAGTAQRWKRSKYRRNHHHVLVHASLNLFDAPKGVEVVNRFLTSIKTENSPLNISVDVHTDLVTELELSQGAQSVDRGELLPQFVSQLRYEFERDVSASIPRART